MLQFLPDDTGEHFELIKWKRIETDKSVCDMN